MHSSTQVQAGISRHRQAQAGSSGLKRAQAGADAFPVARKFRSSDLMQERFFCFLLFALSFHFHKCGEAFLPFPLHRLVPLQRSKRDLISTLYSRSCHVGAAWMRANTAPPALVPVTWMAMQCVRRHENVGRRGGGEDCGTGPRQYGKDKSYKSARSPGSSALPISYHHRDLPGQSYHLSS